MPRTVVIGTAGHIDHGKTTLVRALTGIDADRLPEEKRRGITIDLGFASFEMQAPDGTPLRISFVDVPGHSHFIRNMLAGAGCVPAVMLVIAANEGIMPQTVEHLAICELLGIAHGFTVITKADAVSSSQLHDVTRSVQEFLQHTFLSSDHAPIVPVSAATGEGLATFRGELLNLALRTSLRNSDASMRLPIDRFFVMKGFGAVVTGTLLSGAIHEGQTMLVEPGGRTVRVRGLQTHGQPVQSAQPGSRVAVNLSGVDATQVHRGQTLVVPSTLSPVDTIDAEVRLLKSAPGLKHRASVHFHAFTAETMASISLYSYEPVQPGTVRLMRIKLAEPIVLVPGDRFVLRLPSPAATIGGGRVLDAHPESRQRKAATLAWLEKLRTSSPTQQIVRRVGRRKTQGITLDALSAETGLIQEAVRRHAAHAIESGDLLFINGDLLLGREAFHAAADAIMAHLQIGQGLKSALDTGLSGPGKSPLRLKSSELAPLRGDSELASWREGEFSRRHLKSSELRSQTGLSPEVFQFVINSLVCERKVDLSGEMVSIHFVGGKSSDAGTIAETERLTAIGEAYESAGLAAPSVVELAERFKLKEADMRRFVTMLQRDKTIVRMGSDNLFIHSGALTQLAAQLAPLRGSLIDVARFKQLTGLSRKYAIPLLEYLDRQRITRIQGDRRLIL